MVTGTRLKDATWEITITVNPAIGGLGEKHDIMYRALEAEPGKWDVWRYKKEERSKKLTRGGKYIGADSIEDLAEYLARDAELASRSLKDIRKLGSTPIKETLKQKYNKYKEGEL